MSDVTQSAAEPVNLIGLIDGLIEPPPPPPVSMMPQTWGWAVLAVALAVLAGWLIWRWIAHRRANAYRRAALAELDRAGSDAAEIAAILRRAALAGYPRAQVAGLTGADWLEFLNQTGGDFDAATGAALLAAPYRGDAAADPAVRKAAEGWIRRHRRPDAAPATAQAGRVAA